ncbi:MAG: acetoacetate decarboxylase family protein [Myxococcota bacterium]
MAAERFEIQGRTVSLPVVVRDATNAAAAFLVPSGAAQRWIPDGAFEVAELLPGRALLSIAAIDYRDNDLGDYDEVSIALFVRPRGQKTGWPVIGTVADLARGRLGTYIHRLPVSMSFTCEAGKTIWGFPKTVDDIAIEPRGGRLFCRLALDGVPALSISFPRGGTGSMPEQELVSYTYLDGAPHRTRATLRGEGFAMRLGGAELVLGSHPLANELRLLGLPRRALFTTYTEHMHASFEGPEKL